MLCSLHLILLAVCPYPLTMIGGEGATGGIQTGFLLQIGNRACRLIMSEGRGSAGRVLGPWG